MNKKCVNIKNISRELLANPHQDMPYHERLVKSGAIDLRDNCFLEDFGNGYSIFKPIDKTKILK